MDCLWLTVTWLKSLEANCCVPRDAKLFFGNTYPHRVSFHREDLAAGAGMYDHGGYLACVEGREMDIFLVLRATHHPLNAMLIQGSCTKISNFDQNDDVFRMEFLANIMFVADRPSKIVLEQGARDLLNGWESSFTIAPVDLYSSPPPPSGPYLANRHSLWQVRTLHDDDNRTFLTACILAKDGTS